MYLKNHPMTNVQSLLSKINIKINLREAFEHSCRMYRGANDSRQTTARVDARGRGRAQANYMEGD